MQVGSQSAAALGPFARPIKIAYPTMAVHGGARTFARYLKQHWTKITIAALGGVLAGFFAGALSSREFSAPGQVVYAAGTATAHNATVVATTHRDPSVEQFAGAQASLQEVSRLRMENQQLQALVDELQKERPQSHSRKYKAHRRRHS